MNHITRYILRDNGRIWTTTDASKAEQAIERGATATARITTDAA